MSKIKKVILEFDDESIFLLEPEKVTSTVRKGEKETKINIDMILSNDKEVTQYRWDYFEEEEYE